jgi:Fur family transcriptional regulator, ferric uptake regulator
MAADSIQDTLKQRGFRLTRQRRVLLDLIGETGRHLDVERLYELAIQRDPKLNRVTVYRTIKTLKDAGLIDELDLMHWDGGQHYYETRTKQEHAHVVCLRCGKVQEFFGPPLRMLRRQVESKLGFQVHTVRTELGGFCTECRALPATEAGAAQPPGAPEAAGGPET